MSSPVEIDLEYTGERMMPGVSDPCTYWEHIARYRFAADFVRGRDVVDIACGEGYGTAGMRQAGARSVIGIDVAADAVAHASNKYGIDARVGSAEAVPLPDASADVIVSFETIEHVSQPARFISECSRILRTDGQLIASTPNPEVYRRRSPDNPFHCSEMSIAEFRSLLEAEFAHVRLFGQTWPEPWYLKRRGVRKFSRLARRFLARRPSRMAGFDASDTVKLCAKTPSVFERLLWTDTVQALPEPLLQRSMYVLAVATAR
jgi:SAM-dependent methyltransferase